MLHKNTFQSLAVQGPFDGSVIFHSNTLGTHTFSVGVEWCLRWVWRHVCRVLDDPNKFKRH